jgi:replicative DNA helicase Mcm
MVIVDESNEEPKDPVARFEDFFNNCELEIGNFIYQEKIKELLVMNEYSLLIDFEDMLKHEPALGQMVLDDPEVMLKKVTQALLNILHDKSNGEVPLTSKKYSLSFCNIPANRHFQIRDITDDQEYKLISTSGIVVQKSAPKGIVMLAEFECKTCGAVHDVEQIGDDELTYPAICNIGGCKNTKKSEYRLLHKCSEEIDSREIRIQENPDDSEGKIATEELQVELQGRVFKESKNIEAGDHIRVIGIVEKTSLGKESIEKRKFGRIMHANYIIHEDKQDQIVEVSPENEEKIEKLSKRSDLLDLMGKSLAPDVYGNDEAKKGFMLALFSHDEPGKKRLRIHGLIGGDPATAKSLFLQDLRRLRFPAVNASGSHSTGCGLGGTLIPREKGGYSYVPGAMVLAFGGIMTIDEFGLLPKGDKESLNEALEYGEVPINKGDVHTTVKAKFSCFCAENPKLGRWDDNLTPIENLNIPPATLSRFDLKFVFKDVPEEREDKLIGQNMLSEFLPENSIPKEILDRITRPIDQQLLRQYIYLAHEKIPEVRLQNAAFDYACEYFPTMRQSNGGNGGAIPITKRDLMTITRLALARARMGLRKEATIADVKEVIPIVEASMKQVAFDKDSNTFDVDRTELGTKKKENDNISKMIRMIEGLWIDNHKNPVDRKEIVERLRFSPFNLVENDANALIDKAKAMVFIIENSKGILLVKQ